MPSCTQYSLVGIAATLIVACPSVRSITGFYDQLIGMPIGRYQQTVDREHQRTVEREGTAFPNRIVPILRSYTTDDGRLVYLDSPSPGCEVELYVTNEGIIERYKLLNERCRW